MHPLYITFAGMWVHVMWVSIFYQGLLSLLYCAVTYTPAKYFVSLFIFG
jgi:hypothetical protein